MRRPFALFSTLVFSCLFSMTVFGQEGAVPAPPEGGANHPCVKLKAEAMSACLAAGYVQGGWKRPFPPPNQNMHMGLHRNCMEPIMKTLIAPTNVNASALPDLQACQLKRAGHH